MESALREPSAVVIAHYAVCGGPRTGGTYFEERGTVTVSAASDYDLSAALSTSAEACVEYLLRRAGNEATSKSWAPSAASAEECLARHVGAAGARRIAAHAALSNALEWRAAAEEYAAATYTEGVDDVRTPQWKAEGLAKSAAAVARYSAEVEAAEVTL